MARPLLLVTGMAEGLGAEVAAAFAGASHDVIGLARSDRAAGNVQTRVAQAGGTYTHLACDITQAADVALALKPVADRVDVLVHNAHALLIKPFAETTAHEFEQVWRVACLGAVNAAQAIVPHMTVRGRGTVIFTGATAAIRGGASFSAFASAKFALRGLAQSLAREFGPKGVHVAHVVLDGLIDEGQTEQRFGASASGRMSPHAIAKAYLDLARQEPSAWSHEIDLRPFSERF